MEAESINTAQLNRTQKPIAKKQKPAAKTEEEEG